MQHDRHLFSQLVRHGVHHLELEVKRLVEQHQLISHFNATKVRMMLFELCHSATIAAVLGLHVRMSVPAAVDQAKRTESAAAIAINSIASGPILKLKFTKIKTSERMRIGSLALEYANSDVKHANLFFSMASFTTKGVRQRGHFK